jgi:hypothetical protein
MEGIIMQTLAQSEKALAPFRLHIERHGDIDVDANRIFGQMRPPFWPLSN